MSRPAWVAVSAVCVAVCALLPSSAGEVTGTTAAGRPFGLADVQSIYVVSLGSSEASDRTRRVLIAELESVGFVISRSGGDADVILSGTVVTKHKGGELVVLFERVDLRTPSGEQLWRVSLGIGWRFREFGPGGDGLRTMDQKAPSGPVQRQARHLARALRSRVELAVAEVARNVPE